jgi:hypothetical protein
VGGVQGGSVVGWFEIVGKGDRAALRLALAHVFEFVAAFCDQLVVVLGGRGDGVF